MDDETKHGLAVAALAAPAAVAIHRAARDAGISVGTADILAIGLPVLASFFGGGPTAYVAAGALLGAVGSSAYDAMAGETTFLFFSDSHGNREVRRAVINAMLAEAGVDFVVFGGDAVDGPEDWNPQWDDDTEALRERWKILAVQGNHDDAAGFLRRFPGETPKFVPLRRGTLVLVGVRAAAELRGLGRLLDLYERPIVIVAHKPPFAFSDHNISDADAVMRSVRPYLGRVDAFLSGHMHLFGVATIGRTGIVTAGIAGSKHYRCADPRPPEVIECDSSIRGYLRVTVSAGMVNIEVKTVEAERP